MLAAMIGKSNDVEVDLWRLETTFFTSAAPQRSDAVLAGTS
jgi:hypothetical protein